MSAAQENTAAVTMRPVVVHDAIDGIIVTYSWLTGPLAGEYDAVNYTSWAGAFSALSRQADIITSVYVRGLNTPAEPHSGAAAMIARGIRAGRDAVRGQAVRS